MTTEDQIAATSQVAPLFTPLSLAGCRLRNRIVMAPMTRGFARDGVLAESAIGYYRRRAEGGVGLIISEGIATSDVAAHTANVPHLTAGAPLGMWLRVSSAVHDAGGRIVAQLWHAGLGRQRESAVSPDQPSLGPTSEFLPANSPLAQGGLLPPGREMTQADIDLTIEEYATASENARLAGFDGIELHAAHGYLIDEFFWSESNRRSDRYGGDLVSRTRFAVEIIQEIRRRVGPAFPIGLRFSQWKMPGHFAVKPLADPQQLESMLGPLTAASLDFYDVSTRRYWETEFGTALTLAGWTKVITGKPVVTVGSIGLAGPLDPANAGGKVRTDGDLRRAVQMVEREEVDLIAVGRALLANPDWANRVRVGDVSSLAPYDRTALAAHW